MRRIDEDIKYENIVLDADDVEDEEFDDDDEEIEGEFDKDKKISDFDQALMESMLMDFEDDYENDPDYYKQEGMII